MFRQAITTLWPLSAAAAAVASPTPLLPPVTMIRISAEPTRSGQVGAVVVKVVAAQAHWSRGGHITGGDDLSGDWRERPEQALDLIVVHGLERRHGPHVAGM